MIFKIYLLEFNDGSFYIGQTINIKKRINSHYKKFGRSFTFVIIDECEMNNVLLFECMWMQLFLSWNFKIINGRPWRNVNFNQKLTAGIKRAKKERISAEANSINVIRKPIFWKSGKEIKVVTWAEVKEKNRIRQTID